MSEYLDEFHKDELFKTKTKRELYNIKLVRQSQVRYFKQFFTGKKCIDIGCSMGFAIKELEKTGLNVDGLEPNPKVVEYVNTWIKGKCFQGFYNDLANPETYDIVWLSHVLEHVNNPSDMLNKCYEILKPGGICCIMVPDCTNPETMKEDLTNKYHLSHFTKEEIRKVCTNTNFQIISIESFKEIKNNYRRLHKLLRIFKLNFISDFMESYYPFHKTLSNDGFEIRVVLQKG